MERRRKGRRKRKNERKKVGKKKRKKESKVERKKERKKERKNERKKVGKKERKVERKNDVCILTFHHLFVFSLSSKSFPSLFFSLHVLKTLLEKNSMPLMSLISSYQAQ